MRIKTSIAASVVGVAILAGGVGWYLRSRTALPDTGSPAYEQYVRTFYRGLASLETGLLDVADAAFVRATEIAADEPAGWANLGITRLRSAQFDPAADALDRAVALAPDDSGVVEARAAVDVARGRTDEALALYRRAIDLDPANLRARFAVVELLTSGSDTTREADAAAQLDALATQSPTNLAVLVERARLAARRGDRVTLADSARLIETRAGGWPDPAIEQVRALRTATDANDLAAAARALAFLRNVLARVPEFRDSLAAIRVPVELLAESFDRFLRLESLRATASPADTGLTYVSEPLDTGGATVAVIVSLDASQTTAVFAADTGTIRRIGGGSWPAAGTSAITPLDWNHDFRTDMVTVGPGGVRLLLQDEAGQFSDVSPRAGFDTLVTQPATGAWPADLDMDGDLDIVIGLEAGPPAVLRNNGDGTSRVLGLFADTDGVRGFVWADLDTDGDPDAALLDAAGTLRVFLNEQSGSFNALAPLSVDALALGVGDLTGDGVFDVLTLDRAGLVERRSWNGAEWDSATVSTWRSLPAAPSNARILIADLDNSGAVDVVVTAGGQTAAWLTQNDRTMVPLEVPGPIHVFGTADLTGDGRLDLVGVASGRVVRLAAQGTLPYHWQTVRARAQTTAGDQRVNSFGVGGDVEVRAGLLSQKQVMDGGPVHIGLGTSLNADVARIVWPNGVMQVEFDLQADRSIVAEQRLKGSCPWVFAYNGERMEFVTDFLWRSPLGLRINAQDTAGITQTEDWVRISGQQLVARDGEYDIRITAELWETHFFDHVSLLAVDHLDDTVMFVDERFSAASPPTLETRMFNTPLPVTTASDGAGNDLTALVTARDGRHAAGFARGEYQGITADHVLEFGVGPAAPASGPLWLVAQGWIYPTDSSINVAIAQGRHAPPRGLALDVQEASGAWRTLNDDLGFPAGKNKTILIDLSARPAGARRFRLRTNLEIYWDALSYATPASAPARAITRLPVARADLRYRGFSVTDEDRAAHAPETPQYARIANVTPRWRDLIGYHTRFGDVSELLRATEDRYVIMNAGDEMHLAFSALPAPPAGVTRDFVLIGDGWEKDGDFNTAFSKTVLPLPRHDAVNYVEVSPELERDPAYLRHPDDWQRYHTRFVAPDRYLGGLVRPRRRP